MFYTCSTFLKTRWVVLQNDTIQTPTPAFNIGIIFTWLSDVVVSANPMRSGCIRYCLWFSNVGLQSKLQCKKAQRLSVDTGRCRIVHEAENMNKTIVGKSLPIVSEYNVNVTELIVKC